MITIISPAVAARGISAQLNCVGTDDSGGLDLVYTWSVVTTPPGVAAPKFGNNNGSKSASTILVTLHGNGRYTFMVTVKDSIGATVTSSVDLEVDEPLYATTLVVTPAGSAQISIGQTLQFGSTIRDQFGKVLNPQPTVFWSLTGVGSIDQNGLYTAPGTDGGATVMASLGGLTQTSFVTVVG